MIAAFESVDDLRRQRPEWAPWLGVVGAALDGIADPAWDAAAPRSSAACEGVPRLANATITVDAAAVHGHFERLVRSAAGSATTAHIAGVRDADLDPVAVLEAALNRDRERLARYASDARADADAFAALAALVAMPLRHACNRHAPPGFAERWTQGYCPLCGGWPAYAEIRGVERTRYLRCGDCGGEWQSRCLDCAYCGTTDHERLGSLVPEDNRAGAAIDVCNACRGYVKVFTKLRGSLAARVVLDDLASAELDIAAAARGYSRAPKPAYSLELELKAHAPGDSRA